MKAIIDFFFNDQHLTTNKPCFVLDEPRWDDLNQEEMQQLVEEVQEVAGHVDAMNVSLENAVKNLRAAAEFLDKVWKDCKVASAVGSSAGITGGVLTVLGGVATVMTAGAATPLLIAGTAFGVAGACTNLGTNVVEASANSTVVQGAEEAVENANRAIQTVRERINKLKTGKSQIRLVFLAGLAIRMFGKNHLVVAFIKDLLRTDLLTKVLPSVTNALRAVSGLAVRGGVQEVATVASRGLVETASREVVSVGVNVGARKIVTKNGAKVGVRVAKRVRVATKVGGRAVRKAGTEAASKATGNTVANGGSKAVGKAGAQGGAKAAGGFIIGVSAAFLVLDVIDLAFTVRDIVKNEGSDAARSLRDKADEYEEILNHQ